MATHVYMVALAPLEGQQAAFNAFYEDQHIPDVLRIPGIVGCRRVKLADELMSSEGAATYLALYDFDTDDAPGAIAEIRARMGTPQMPVNTFADPSSRALALYDIIFETPEAAGWAAAARPASSKHIFMTSRGPKPGQEAAYDRFYNDIHIPEVCSVSGFVGCRRLKLALGFQSAASALPYLALYEINAPDGRGPMGDLFVRGKAGEFRNNDHAEAPGGQMVYDVIFERHN